MKHHVKAVDEVDQDEVKQPDTPEEKDEPNIGALQQQDTQWTDMFIYLLLQDRHVVCLCSLLLLGGCFRKFTDHGVGVNMDTSHTSIMS